MTETQLLEEVPVFVSSMNNSYKEFTALTLFEALVRCVWEYHENDIVWYVNVVRNTRTGTYVECSMYYAWDAPENTWEFTVHMDKRTIYIPKQETPR